jgi:hypothetical protein
MPYILAHPSFPSILDCLTLEDGAGRSSRIVSNQPTTPKKYECPNFTETEARISSILYHCDIRVTLIYEEITYKWNYTEYDKMKEGNRLNELVIKGTVPNESLGPAWPTSPANKTNYVAAFCNYKALGIEFSASTFALTKRVACWGMRTVARGKKGNVWHGSAVEVQAVVIDVRCGK